MKTSCTIRENAFVEPCDGLSKLMGRAVQFQSYADLKTLKPTRSLVAIKSGEFSRNGLVVNFCPVCGERINHAVEAADAA